MFNALDELFARTQENEELEWMDLLGNRSKCIFKYKSEALVRFVAKACAPGVELGKREDRDP